MSVREPVTRRRLSDDKMTDSVIEDSPEQQIPLPLAFVHGEAIVEKPEDLYIPPEALEVILESFSGPLDLLLYLIRRHKLDIIDLPITQITRQYVEYVELMKDLKLELAADYLLMSATLAEIKSRLLLPTHDSEDEEDDPRAELIRRLQEYEALKQAAQSVEQLPRNERDVFIAEAVTPDACQPIKLLPHVQLQSLVMAFQQAMERADNFKEHTIAREALSTRERMSKILEYIEQQEFVNFEHLFATDEGRQGVVVSFLAILELVKESLIELVQIAAYQPITIRKRLLETAGNVYED